MSKTKKNSLIALTLLVGIGLIWSSGYVIAKYVITNGVHPLGYSFWQSLGPAILLVILCYSQRMPLSWQPGDLRFYLICGLLGIAIPNTNMYFAAPHLPAGILALVVNTVPIMIYPMALLLRQEQFAIGRFIAILLGIIGLLFIVLPQGGLPEPDQWPWVLTALLTPLSFALSALYISCARPQYGNSLVLSAGMLLSSALLLSPLVFSGGYFYQLVLPFSLSDWLILLEIGLSALGYYLLFRLLEIACPVYYSLISGVVVLCGLFWGWLIFAEHLNVDILFAVGLILLAIALLTLQFRVRD